MLSTQHRPSTSAPSDGSRTVIVHDVQAKPEGDEDAAGPSVPEGTLRLRGGPRRHPRVAWDEGVVDNEDCGRKKSKICCIYHKPKEFDESSDESSSDEDSDSFDDRRHARRRHTHHHDDQHPRSSGATSSGAGNGLRRGGEVGGVVAELEDLPKPNAYESLPKNGKCH